MTGTRGGRDPVTAAAPVTVPESTRHGLRGDRTELRVSFACGTEDGDVALEGHAEGVVMG